MSTILGFTRWRALIVVIGIALIGAMMMSAEHRKPMQGELQNMSATVAAASGEQVVYLTGHKPGTNLACPSYTAKMFIVAVRVPRGQQIKAFGSWSLDIQGRKSPLVDDDGSQVNRRLVEYYFSPKSRAAKVALGDLTTSYAYMTFTGSRYSAIVRRQCNGLVP